MATYIRRTYEDGSTWTLVHHPLFDGPLIFYMLNPNWEVIHQKLLPPHEVKHTPSGNMLYPNIKRILEKPAEECDGSELHIRHLYEKGEYERLWNIIHRADV